MTIIIILPLLLVPSFLPSFVSTTTIRTHNFYSTVLINRCWRDWFLYPRHFFSSASWSRLILLIEEKKKRKGRKTGRAIFSPIRGDRWKDWRERESRNRSARLIYFSIFTSPPFVFLFTHRRFLLSLPERRIIRNERLTLCTNSRKVMSSKSREIDGYFFFFFLHANFRKENLSRDACSRIVNRNIDNYGYNVSRIVN